MKTVHPLGDIALQLAIIFWILYASAKFNVTLAQEDTFKGHPKH